MEDIHDALLAGDDDAPLFAADGFDDTSGAGLGGHTALVEGIGFAAGVAVGIEGVDVDAGGDGAGGRQSDGDAVGRFLEGEGLKETVEGVFGGAIGRPLVPAKQPGEAGDRENVSFGRAEQRQRGLGEGNGAEVVDLHDFAVGFFGGFVGVGTLADAAVVDEDIYPAGKGLDIGDGAGDAGAVGEVEGHGVGFAAAGCAHALGVHWPGGPKG